jgi:hypothetical protein
MRALVAIAAMEIRQRWTVLPAALLSGVLALAVPLFSALGKRDVREARELAALVFAAAFAFGVAAVVGAGMITRELVERRHGFLFARPLSSAAIWSGKVLACWLLALGAGVAALLPAAVASGGVHLLGSLSPWGDGAATLGVAAAVLLALVGFSHAIALMVRSRVSWLLALDAALAVAVVTTVALALRSLYLAYAQVAMTRVGIVLAVAALVAPLAAGLVQVTVGRTDIRRGHTALSATLWGTLGAVALAVTGYAAWLRAADIGDLEELTMIECAPKGNWAFVRGEGRARGDYQSSFLLDTQTGKSLAIGAAGQWWLEETFSSEGTRAVWLSPPWRVTDSVRTLMTVDLADPDAHPSTTPITTAERWFHVLGVSPDGRQVATMDSATLSVSEIASGKIVVSVRAPANLGAVHAVWTLPGVVRLVAWNAVPANSEQADLRLFELNIAKRSMNETGRVDGVNRHGFWFMAVDPVRGRILTRTGSISSGALVLVDASSGARIATLASCDGTSLFRSIFVSGGKIAVTSAEGDAARVLLFSPEGVLERTFALGPGQTVNLAAQPTRDTLVATVRLRRDDTSDSRRSVVVNLTTGSVEAIANGVRPLAWYPWRDGLVVPEPGSVASRAFIDSDGHLAVLEPGSAKLRTVLKARWHAE